MNYVTAALFTGAIGLGGCVEIESTDVVIDLLAGRVTIDIHGLASDFDALDLRMIEGWITNPEPLVLVPGLRFASVSVVPTTERLDLHAEATFAKPADFGLRPWDARFPYRYCPNAGFLVMRTNAAARDADGCILWPVGTRILRLTIQPSSRKHYPSLLDAWRKRSA